MLLSYKPSAKNSDLKGQTTQKVNCNTAYFLNNQFCEINDADFCINIRFTKRKDINGLHLENYIINQEIILEKDAWFFSEI